MGIKLTDFQQASVDNTGGTLLIAAAAGSGKTQVLIDRMLKRVQSETDPCNIDDFLMITFTKAAATELRGKIMRRLNTLLAEQEPTAHLQSQLSRVYLAQISTIHSFCASLLRDYAHHLDLPADFRVMEDSEAKATAHRVMENLLDEVYINGDEEIFATLDILGAGRDDSELPQIIFSCHEAICNTTDPEEKLRYFAKLLTHTHNEDISNLPWAKFIIEEFHHSVYLLRLMLENALKIIRSYSWLDAYVPALEADIALMDSYMFADTWEKIRNIPLEFTKLATIKKPENPELKDYVKDIRDKVKKDLKAALETFDLPSEQIIEDLCRTDPPLRGLLRLAEEYGRRYNTEKRRKHLLDYNDLEQETLRLLYGNGTTPTPVAKEISQRYVELMIDEYQDTNSVQDAIFSAISREGKNLFFVGDVKQSIYGFRGAEPQIFTEKYDTYPDYTQAIEGQPRKILLSDNFRSSAAILEAANDVFRLTMNRRVGAVEYNKDVALRPDPKKPKLSYPAVELHCINVNKDDLDADFNRLDLEAKFVAQRIRRILKEEKLPTDGGERDITPGDIVILLRAVKGRAKHFRDALIKQGIPAECSSENLFETEEFSFLESLLRVIDNPHQDIPLLSVLLSPVIRLSPEILASVRQGWPKVDIYSSLRSERPDLSFMISLQRLRRVARQSSIRELMDEIEEEFSLRVAFSENQTILDAFSQIVQQFESGGLVNLSAFLSHLERIKAKGVEVQGGSGNAVQIITIHKSKGLEYPVVFLCDLCKSFDFKDAKHTVQMDTEFGIAAKVYDPTDHTSYPTAVLNAIAKKTRRDGMSEEMRLLYVAMTRPEQRLIMTYCTGNVEKRINKFAKTVSIPMPPQLIESAGCMGDWILQTALTHRESSAICDELCPDAADSPYPWHMELHYSMDDMQENDTDVSTQESAPLLPLQEICYVHETAVGTPGKLTATQLKGRVEDDELEAMTYTDPRFDKPNFQQKPLSGAERGIAIHTAMQYIVYERCTTEDGVRKELDRLLNEKFLTPQQFAAVAPDKILNFFRSPLGHRVLSADRVIREFKFSLLQDGDIYDARLSGEQFLLQGVTDCCIVEQGMLSVLDFKSDRVSKSDMQEKGEYYRGQIETYAQALSRIFGLPVKDKILYFFSVDSSYEL